MIFSNAPASSHAGSSHVRRSGTSATGGTGLTRTRRSTATLLSCLFALALAGRAHAQQASAVTAEALFDDAVRLMKAGNYDAACPKLVESQRLDPGVGTLVYLGECYSRSGRTASAWVTWRDASAAARVAGQADREKMARAKADALEPTLSRLVVGAQGAAPGLEIKRDGVPVASVSWGTPIPVDPGPHEITATAPGKRTWSKTVSVDKAQRLDIVVPPLEDEPVAAPPQPAPTAVAQPAPAGAAPTSDSPPVATNAAEKGSTRRTIAASTAGVGVLAAAVGAAFGVHAASIWHGVQARCPNNTCTDSTGPDDVHAARVASGAATGLIIGGAALVAGGAVLWFTAPSQKSTRGSIHVTPVASQHGGFVVMGGAF